MSAVAEAAIGEEGAACCPAVLAEPLSEDRAADLAHLFKVLADPVRLRILSAIAGSEGNEACVCDIVDRVDRSQPTISHHLTQLTEARVLAREKRGRWAFYRLLPDRFAGLRDALAIA